jgi:hypothetical protein
MVSSVLKDHEGALKNDNLFAGQHVSLDHFICGTKGRLFTSMGKMSDSEMFDGGCVFIDSATGFIHLVLQVNRNTHETLNGIHEFEQVCRNHGVVPQLYHSDNASVFTSEGMAEKLKRFPQIITFAGAGAHLVSYEVSSPELTRPDLLQNLRRSFKLAAHGPVSSGPLVLPLMNEILVSLPVSTRACATW